MTPEDNRNISLYRLERAANTFKDAEILLNNHSLQSTVNRLYYALFYSVSALASAHDFHTSKHTGLRSWFNKNLVHPGIISIEMGTVFNKVFELRSKGDYADFVELDETEVTQLFHQSKTTLNTLRSLTLEKLKLEENNNQ